MTDTPPSPAHPERDASPSAVVAPPSRVVTLASGRAIEVAEEGGAELVRIRAAEGQLLVAIRLTAEGPVLSVAGASVEIAATKALALSCDTLRIQAAQDATIEVGGAARLLAREVEVEAEPGGVTIQANDDVSIRGERVRLNTDEPPMPLSHEEHRARHALAARPPALEAPAPGGAGGHPRLQGPPGEPGDA